MRNHQKISKINANFVQITDIKQHLKMIYIYFLKLKDIKTNKSASAAQDPRSTVQFNPPLFWTFLGGGGIFFRFFFRGGI